MVRRYLWTIRGQLVLWYLSVLAVLLIALGIFQSVTLSQYLSSSTAQNIQQAAVAELGVLGPCYVRSLSELETNAERLARLLGSRDTAVKIVTPTGETLADHSFGPLNGAHPLQLSAATIRRLIKFAAPATSTGPSVITEQQCKRIRNSTPPAGNDIYGRDHPALHVGRLLLVAVPIGPSAQPLGYALLGRSMASADETVFRTKIVFALGALVALLVAGIVALPLINRALRPLRRIARTAGAIASGDVQQRANLTHSPDEIGRLGDAFDAMVDRLQEALTRANESEENMRRFLADASHELRTPLTVLRGTSEVLLRQVSRERPEFVGAIRDMHEESLRLSKLVDDLLTLTRLDTEQQLNPEQVQVRPFLEQFTDRYATAWPNRDVRLDLEELNGASAYIDPDALRRIVTNLVDNAARYSIPGKPITVAGKAEDNTVTVAVADEGPGLTPEDAERVFERFYRGAKSRSRHSGGTGLGLSIVHSLTEQSGGHVRIETAPERGTTVSVDLPQVSEEPESGVPEQ